MNSKQDYFRSPAPKNIQGFYSPFKLLRHEQDPILVNTLLSPFNRISNSPFSLYSASHLNDEQDHNQQSKAKDSVPLNSKLQKVILFENQESEQQSAKKLQTPYKNSKSITNIETTSRKKYDLRVLDIQQKINFTRDTERGLRALSKQAYQIFHHSQPMTYQEVAERIIEESQQLHEYPEKKKQRQSIKRRVYDALNVLIAVGILQKNGKRISLCKKISAQNHQPTRTKDELEKQLQHRIKLLESKKKRIQQIQYQRSCLNKLIHRNEKYLEGEQRINFPFVIGFQLSQAKDRELTKFKEFVCADMEAIQKLKLNTKQ